ncbi:MAG: rod shape-determining protein RodA [Pseudomonadota bacterium]
MAHLTETPHEPPRGLQKVLALNWGLALLVVAVAVTGFLMLFSVAGGSYTPWAQPQILRFTLGFAIMFTIAMIPIRFWLIMAIPAYLLCICLLVLVEFIGVTGMGAQRWIDLGFMRLQPSELAKIGVVMVIAAYYHWLPEEKVSRPLYVIPPLATIALPMALTVIQPDLGTALLLGLGGAIVMFLAGVSWWYWGTAITAGVGTIVAVFQTRGTELQLLKDYQYRRIETFLDPSQDPLGAGYHITQSQIALGSGGWTGRGFMQGTQSRLNFLPEKHTDFIFTTLGEEFGVLGGLVLLGLYALIVIFCLVSALTNAHRFGALLTLGIAVTFFFYFAVNMGMVMGLLPVVGVPLPLVSYGGSAMIVLMGAFGLVQSAHIHRVPR